MGLNRFVTTKSVRIELSGGDWIEIKKDLNTGEQKLLEAAGLKEPIRLNDGTIHTPVDWSVYELMRAEIFLLEWSFRNGEDKHVPLTIDSLRALDPVDFEEVNNAIFKYVSERMKSKKAERLAMLNPSPTPETQPTSEAVVSVQT